MSTKAFKNDKVALIKEKIDKAQVAVVSEYTGLSVEEITKLRRELQKEGGDYMVTKNTLAKIAIKGTPYEVLAETLKGPIAIAFGFTDQVAPAKVLSKFIKDTKKGEIIAAAMDGQCLQKKQKPLQIFHQEKNFMQKCLDASTHLHLVSQTLSMLLCHLLLELLQQLEIKNPHRIRGLNKPNGETKNHLISLVFCQWSCNKNW